MKCRPIKVDGSLLELTQHGSSDFPVSMDRQDVAHQEHGGVRHWHYEIQIAVVTRGSVIFRTPEGSYRVERGQGFYVNGGVLHEAVPTQTNDGEYICVMYSVTLPPLRRVHTRRPGLTLPPWVPWRQLPCRR